MAHKGPQRRLVSSLPSSPAESGILVQSPSATTVCEFGLVSQYQAETRARTEIDQADGILSAKAAKKRRGEEA
jgi:hypothetical protein